VKIRDVFGGESPSLSFEFFPPRDSDGVDRLFQSVRALAAFEPSFVSVTCGAGGSTRTTTAEIVERLQKDEGLCAMAHFTCVGSSRAELLAVARDLEARGIENVLALRGDPPKGEASFRAAEGGLSYASELLQLLRAQSRFCLGAACYPEKHPEAATLDMDLARLAEKVNAGAEFLLTQFFFEADDYFSYVARARAHGIRVPIVPGVLPVTDLTAVLSMARKCGATVPASVRERLEGGNSDPDAQRERGLELTRELCETLLAHGAPGLHLYTRNRSDVIPVLRALGWPKPASRPWSARSLNADAARPLDMG
jgi:methylenetetrahydrofolate reductase (NADPH)